MNQEKRGLRFPFTAGAEIILESSPESIRVHVTELSLRGCFLEIPFSLKEQQRVQLKIFSTGEYFEACAEVIYVRPTGIIRRHEATLSECVAGVDSHFFG